MYHSPFRQVVHTNFAPSDAEIIEIRDFLKTPYERLPALDARVQTLLNQLEDAVKERDQVKELIVDHEALLSPIRRVPIDVLRLIFIHTLPDTRNTALSDNEGPLLLSRVCKEWREITHTTPQLWSSLHIVVPTTEPYISNLKRMLDTWLVRSGAMPLSVKIFTGNSSFLRLYHHHRTPPRPPPVISLLAPVSSRWRNMAMTIHRIEDLETLESLSKEDVPLLADLDLSFDYRLANSASAEEHQTLDARCSFKFVATRQLRRFFFHGTYTRLPRTPQWGNLRILKLALSDNPQTSITFPFPFLHQCTCLELLYVHIRRYNLLYDANSDEIVHLPLLRSLQLELPMIRPNEAVNRILDRFSLPQLAHLHLSRKTSQSLDKQMFRVIPHLRQLTMTADGILSDTLLEALSVLPVLQHLRMLGEPRLPNVNAEPVAHGPNGMVVTVEPARNQIDPDFLRAFLPHTDSTLLCPSLQCLEIANACALADELIVQFLLARTSPTVPTRLVRFNCTLNRAAQGGVQGHLVDVLSQGFRLGITYYPPPLPKTTYSPLEGAALSESQGEPRLGQDWGGSDDFEMFFL
ncbi:F-box domain-containing protein [Mycena indigotica]|uniref:F-box domain-containing protein n=1 Tax=Mycena indigotica TaxID=2126181 RepID=A0A8H6VX36_9AGAR|nr:F-box domain-containing protein [Mycena indigotica]KAF7297284.1 F-box domain-containing protein [Mycena indigotica]